MLINIPAVPKVRTTCARAAPAHRPTATSRTAAACRPSRCAPPRRPPPRPGAHQVELVRAMADIEHRLANGASERLQLGGLAAAFTRVREATVAQAV
jgi:hypothetical protein